MAKKVPVHELHRVVATCIIYNEHRKFFIGLRPKDVAIFPNMWGVPGGGMSRKDYEHLPLSLHDGWDNPLDTALRREIRQETNMEVGALRYVGNFSHIRSDDVAVLGVRFAAPYKSGAVKLKLDEIVEHQWVSAGELSKYPCMGGIVEAIQRVDRMLIRENVGRAAL